MESLIIVLALFTLIILCMSIHLYVVLIHTLTQHRRTMHSVHQKIELERLREQRLSVVGDDDFRPESCR